MAMDALIFIDTNIFLDFYRVRSGGVGLELLSLIEVHKDIIITGSQVEMEYKKNRQRVVLEALNAQKSPEWGGLAPPAFLASTQPVITIKKSQDTIRKQQAKLKEKIASILDRPTRSDPVYQTLDQIFKNDGPFNLSRNKQERFEIRELAKKRFVLGYPPRKQGDTSIGDAINWEWIVHCANMSSKDIILVTRDTDYGISHEKQYFLNDWLRQEFADRVSKRRKILLTDRLAAAFKEVAIPVSREAEEAEAALIDDFDDLTIEQKPAS